MKSLTRSIIGASGLILAGGCAVLPNGEKFTVAPHESARLGVNAADGQYQLAKYYVGQQRHALALIAFTRAIEYDPNHADARNGRATMLVEFGDLQAAMQELQRAISISPTSVHLLNNLGYVQVLAGDLAGAATTFKRAFAIDPKNARVRANWSMLAARAPSGTVSALADASDSIGNTERVKAKTANLKVETITAETTRADQGDPVIHTGSVVNLSYESRPARASGDSLTVQSNTIPPIYASHPRADRAPEAAGVLSASVSASGAATAVINLRIPAESVPPIVAAPTAVSVAVAPPSIARAAIDREAPPAIGGGAKPNLVGVAPERSPAMASSKQDRTKLRAKIEISNGNGIRFAAKTVGHRLAKKGVVVVRLSNAPTFDVERSAIYFRDGHLDSALALSRALATRPAIMLGLQLADDTDLKLVIGRDVATQAELDSLVPGDHGAPRKVALLK